MLFVTLVAIAIFHLASASYTCLECTDVTSAKDCSRVKRCGPHEVCFTELFVNHVGALRFALGCRDKYQCPSSRTVRSIQHARSFPLVDGAASLSQTSEDTPLVCSECCGGDLCNSGGCGETVGYGNWSIRGPVCFNCNSQNTVDDCDTIKVCGIDEICVLRASSPGTAHRFESSCASTAECSAVNSAPLIGRSVISDGQCTVSCCSQDLCNSACDNGIVIATPPPPVARSTVPLVCLSNPCVHGRCASYLNTYYCECKTNFYGRNCELSANSVTFTTVTSSFLPTNASSKPTTPHTYDNHCLSNPCRHGSCQASDHGYTCNCTTPYGGEDCDVIVRANSTSQNLTPTPQINTSSQRIPTPKLTTSSLSSPTTKLPMPSQRTPTPKLTTSSQRTPTPEHTTSSQRTHTTKVMTSLQIMTSLQSKTTTASTTSADPVHSEPCRLDPCVYGRCYVNATAYVCHCYHGYFGRHCENHYQSDLDCPVGRRTTMDTNTYYPSLSQGGFYDRYGAPLMTLQDYLARKVSLVTVALPMHMFPYNTQLCIPELNHKYGQVINFVARDISEKLHLGADMYICVGSEQDMLDSSLRGPLTVVYGI